MAVRSRWAALVLLQAAAAAAEPITIRGRVLAAAGDPLAGAAVTLRAIETEREDALHEASAAPPAPLAATTSGRDGAFRIAAPGAGFYRVEVAAPRRVPLVHYLPALVEETELPDVRLRDDVGIEVEVVAASGAPLAGAWVSVESTGEGPWARDGPLGWIPAARRGRADERGHLRLPRAEGERLVVVAAADDHAPGHVESEGGPARVALARGVERRLVVRDERGRPSAGAQVVALDARRPLGVTGPDGGLALRSPPGELLRLHVFGPDGRFGAANLPPVAADAAASTGSIALASPTTVSGRVIDAAERHPLAGALVWSAGHQLEWTRTDAGGGFRLATWPADEGRLEVRATAAGRLAAGAPAPAGDGELTLALEPARALAGVVVDERDSPLAGVEVAAHPDRHRPGRVDPRPALTRSDGRFAVRGLDPDGFFALRVRGEGYASVWVDVFPLPAGAPAPDLRIVLARGGAIVGRVEDGEGRAAAQAKVSALPSLEMRQGPAGGRQRLELVTAATDAAGRFALRHLPSGRWDLAVAATGHVPLVHLGVELQAPAVADLGALVVEAGAALAGRVADPRGTPIAGARVVAEAERGHHPLALHTTEPPTVTTAADGSFALAGFEPERTVALHVSRGGYGKASVEVVPPLAAPLAITLHPASALSGRVVDRAGRPVGGARVRLEVERRRGSGMTRWSVGDDVGTDETGSFRFAAVDPGLALLTVVAPGFQTARVAELEVAAGADLEGVEIVLAPGAVVSGRVVNADGRPQAGATVGVLTPEDFPGTGTPTDGNGAYRLDGVEPGPRRVAATGPEGDRVVAELDVVAGENRLDFRLPGGVEVAGRVVDEGRAPVVGAEVQLLALAGGGGGRRRAASGADGAFRFPSVPDGKWIVAAAAAGFAPLFLPEPLVVAGRPRLDLEVRLSAGGRIAGEVRGLRQGDLARVRVSAMREGGGRGGTAVMLAGDGRYRLSDLQPGRWRVSAMVVDSARRATGEVTVETGEEAILDLDLPAGGELALSGRVRRAGEPRAGVGIVVDGVDVEARGEAVSAFDGTFRVAGLSAGRYELHAHDPTTGGGYRDELVIESDREIEIVIAGAVVTGAVVDAQDGSPLAGASVAVLVDAGARRSLPSLFGRRLETDSRGVFRFVDLAPGRWRLAVAKEGYAAVERELAVADEGLDELRIELEPTALLVLEIANPGALDPRSVRVAATDAAGLTVVSQIEGGLAEGGRLRLASLHEGEWTIVLDGGPEAIAMGNARVPGPPLRLTVAPAAYLHVRLPGVSQGTEATVQLLDGQGRPLRLPGHGAAASDRWPLLGEGWAFVPAIPPGVWTIVATADGRRWTTALALAPGEHRTVTLE
jgi:uncharacterized GH25 family protein